LTARSIGYSGGEEDHTLTSSEMPSHDHQQHNSPGALVIPVGAPSTFYAHTDPGLPAWTGSAGGGNEHNNMPPFHALTFGIIAR